MIVASLSQSIFWDHHQTIFSGLLIPLVRMGLSVIADFGILTSSLVLRLLNTFSLQHKGGQRLRVRLHQVLHCVNSVNRDANANTDNGTRPVADLGGAQGTRPPPGDQNSFDFMQFLGKFGKIVCWRPPWGVGAPSSGKSWIRHCRPFQIHFLHMRLCYHEHIVEVDVDVNVEGNANVTCEQGLTHT